jgi:hypothetical protein
MQFDIAVIIQATPPRHPPGGACGTELTTYLRLLHRYKHAVDSGAAYGPPRFVTISQAEQRVVEACKPAPAHA